MSTKLGDLKPRPVAPLRALQAFHKLVKNREDTRLVFEFFEALNGKTETKFFNRMLSSNYGKFIAENPNHIGQFLSDRKTLESFGADTFASRYLHYLDSESLSVEGVNEAAWEHAPEYMASLKDEYPHIYAIGYMTQLTHDLYHVLTGYGRDPLGEALLLVFTATMTGVRGPAFLGRLAGLRIRYEVPSWPVGRMMAEAVRNARAAEDFPTTNLTEYMHLPINEARRQLNVTRPKLYKATLKSWRGPMPVEPEAEAV